MRVSLGSGPSGLDPTVVVATRPGLPRPVVWLLWLVGALVGSVVLGFLAGLARPREPDPWTSGTSAGEQAADHVENADVDNDQVDNTQIENTQVETTSSDSSPLPSEDD